MYSPHLSVSDGNSSAPLVLTGPCPGQDFPISCLRFTTVRKSGLVCWLESPSVQDCGPRTFEFGGMGWEDRVALRAAMPGIADASSLDICIYPRCAILSPRRNARLWRGRQDGKILRSKQFRMQVNRRTFSISQVDTREFREPSYHVVCSLMTAIQSVLAGIRDRVAGRRGIGRGALWCVRGPRRGPFCRACRGVCWAGRRSCRNRAP